MRNMQSGHELEPLPVIVVQSHSVILRHLKENDGLIVRCNHLMIYDFNF